MQPERSSWYVNATHHVEKEQEGGILPVLNSYFRCKLKDVVFGIKFEGGREVFNHTAL